MRVIFRNFLYIAISVFLTQMTLSVFNFGEVGLRTVVIFCLALGLVVILSKPFLKIVSFPVGGIVYHLLLLVIITLTIFALSTVLPDFAFNSVILPEAVFSGIIVGGFEVSGFGSIALAGVSTSALFSFLSLVSG
jgi:hypothetical protein